MMRRRKKRFEKRNFEKPDPTEGWIPKTELGRKVMNGEITDIQDVLSKGLVIRESEIVDKLVPGLKEQVILIGGRVGKGGGMKRITMRITNTMQKSGRRRTVHAMMAVGNENGLLGLGYARGKDGNSAIKKAGRNARMNLVMVMRGCGSWDCRCGGRHSIPFRTDGKKGATTVELMPAPKGLGLVSADETKKLFRLVGVRDVWSKSRGQTKTRVNFISATFSALKNLSKMRVDDNVVKNTGMVEGLG